MSIQVLASPAGSSAERFCPPSRPCISVDANTFGVSLLGRCILVCLTGIARFVFVIVLAAALGLGLAWLNGDQFVSQLGKWHALLTRISEAVLPPGTPHVARKPEPGMGAETPPPATVAPRPVPAVREKPRAIYHAHTERLEGDVLPLHVAPDPYSRTVARIPPYAVLINGSGESHCYRERDRYVLWLRLTYHGYTGWASAFYIKDASGHSPGDSRTSPC